jgi:hypothetical protein
MAKQYSAHRNRAVNRKEQAELINPVLELAASTGKTSVRAINEARRGRDERFCSIQFGDQKLSVALRNSGFFHFEPVTNSEGTVDDYEVRPISASTFPAEEAGRQELSCSRLVSGASTEKTYS